MTPSEIYRSSLKGSVHLAKKYAVVPHWSLTWRTLRSWVHGSIMIEDMRDDLSAQLAEEKFYVKAPEHWSGGCKRWRLED